ncbi:MAG: hypothetical protein M1821_006971 [Bathelium mastoideum]|nr:MAG: hypothetical protein M1821_006971 [Bathelium mastoideum]KAI9683506.1 MAG: hypothetical protein M1822_006046 [Bathelium mastoideum]
MTVVINAKKLQWTQRVALIRQNLHSASRTGDFTFFKTLQAQAFFEGTDYVATLTAAAGDDADFVISTIDNLNAGIAYCHQDAFKNVYDRAKEIIASEQDFQAKRASIRVDISQQKQMAEFAIDKMANSAISVIEQQAPGSRDAVAHVWVTGTTIIADAIEVCLMKINDVEYSMDDLIGLEDSYNVVKNAVGSGISALKGIFSLMTSDPNAPNKERIQPTTASSYAKGVFRRFSNAVSIGPVHNATPPISPTRAVHTPSSLRASISLSNPTTMPSNPAAARIAPHLTLNVIPGSPAVDDEYLSCPFVPNSPFNKKNPFEPALPPSPPSDPSEKGERTNVIRRLSAALWPTENHDGKVQRLRSSDEAQLPPSRVPSFSSIRDENLSPLDKSCKEHGEPFERSLLVGYQPPVAV